MKTYRVSLVLIALFATAMSARSQSLLSNNLLLNGDFEQGNTGFSSAYVYSPASDANQGDYAVVSNPHSWNSGGFSMSDHTSGSGLMLAVNGSSQNSNLVLWREIISVNPNQAYSLSGWRASWGTFGDGTEPSPATLRISINSLQLGDVSAPSLDGQWSQFTLGWNSGASTQATIEIRDLNTAFLGNDFALDDLSFLAVPEPSSAVLLLAGLLVARITRTHKRTSA